MNVNPKEIHTFSVLAYKESPYIEEAIQSLKAQTVESNIIVCTSTPSPFLEDICNRYNVALKINTAEEKGVASDYDFALAQPDTNYVTLAHQDDIYLPNYCEEMLKSIEKYPDSSIYFTDHIGANTEGKEEVSLLVLIKRFILFLNYGLGYSMKNTFRKRFLFALGCPIISPSVTFNRELLAEFKFSRDYRFAIDWAAWKVLAMKEGRFTYVRKALLAFRIHPGSETSAASKTPGGLLEHGRYKEDLALFKEFWPDVIAKLLARLYSLSYTMNNA